MKSKKPPLYFILFLLMALVAFFLSVYLRWQDHFSVYKMPVINENTRLLVIAPHCDDETLSSCGLINTVIRSHGRVQVVILTHGDASYSGVKYFRRSRLSASDYIRFGEIRGHESKEVLNVMKVSPADIFFPHIP